MSLSSPFIRRPVATTLLTIALALAGAVAFNFLPVSPLPQVDFPTISVGASLPGASPEIMASSVATPLERQFGRIAGVTEMTSSSFLGTTSITLQFDLNRDINGAARDVQAAINAARSYLPANLPSNPTYRKVNPADAPIMIIALTSDVYDRGPLYDAASTIMSQKLSQIQGVGQVTVGGSSLPSVRVELNPVQLNGYGLGVQDVQKMLSVQNANLPKGQISNGETTADIITNDQLLKAEYYKPLIVGYHKGAAIKLSDVADVQDSVENIRASGYVNGKPSVLVIISRQPGANIIDTVDRIYSELPSLKASIPSAINLTVVLDRTTTIRASVKDVERTLALSVALVILVVFFFLRNVRATLIPSVAVPVSLIGTFGIMYLCHYSLDNLSLMALTISTGFVVDDAIVVIENISRYLEQGMQSRGSGVGGSERDRIYGDVDQYFARGRVHSDPADGGDCWSFVPRVCSDALGSDLGFSRYLAYNNPDDVRQALATGIFGKARRFLSPEREVFYLDGPYLRTDPWRLFCGTRRLPRSFYSSPSASISISSSLFRRAFFRCRITALSSVACKERRISRIRRCSRT